MQENTEYHIGIKVATAASKTASFHHYICSSLPGPEKLSRGKLPHCDAKAIVDRHILDQLPELAKKTTFLWVGYYASNLAYFPLCKVEYFVSRFFTPVCTLFPFSFQK